MAISLSNLYLPASITTDPQAATKAYVDAAGFTDLARCYFRLALNTPQSWGVDGGVRVVFDSEVADPAGIAVTGASAGITCPRAGRMQFAWNASMETTSGTTTALNITSWLTLSPSGDKGRGSSLTLAGPSCGVGSGHTSHCALAVDVTVGQIYFVTGYISAPGAGKRANGGGLTWFEGYYLTP
jgi:hypothetical protein